jgi:dihydroorotate dehydrogenase
MKLRGVEWGHVFNSSGGRGFAKEGYWFHTLSRPLGLRYEGSTFVAKTTTLMPRKGNMPLDDDYRPRSLAPSCVVVKPLKGVVLNAVGLSGPGAKKLIALWQKKAKETWTDKKKSLTPFVVSFMSVEKVAEDRITEAGSFVELLKPLVQAVGTDFLALQVNLSCPNVGLDTSHLLGEAASILDRTRWLGIATMVKLNALVPPLMASKMSAHDGCDAIVCSNTIPWGQHSRIDWEKLFGTAESPLAQLGGGGLSGKPLLPIVEEWIRSARASGLIKPIVGGGGVLSRGDADRLIDAGASAIELGSVSILRPWRVAGIIRHVNARLGRPQ